MTSESEELQEHADLVKSADGQSEMTNGHSVPATQTLSMRLSHTLFAPVDNGWLVYFRILFGIEMLWTVWKHYDGFRLQFNINSPFLFKYYGFEWVQTWPEFWMWFHLGAMGILAVFIILGLLYRLSMSLFCLGFTYLFLLNQANYLNHYYLVCLLALVMIFIPAHQSFSVDALFRRRIRSSVAPQWAFWLLRIQVGIPYFFGGIAKINRDWLQGAPMDLWLTEASDEFPGSLGEFFRTEEAAYLFSYGGLTYDLLIVPMLLWRRTRLLAYAGTIFFHMMNTQLFQIGIFPWLMMLGTLIYFPPEVPRKLLSRFTQVRPAVLPRRTTTTLTVGQKTVVASLSLYLAFQCLFPLRHHLYPGYVSWTEEGHRFSWHMMLRAKRGIAFFYAYEPSTGRALRLDPIGFLNPRQMTRFADQPRMLQQFAIFLANDPDIQAELRRRGLRGRLEIRVDGWVTLNGRQPQRLVDPFVDLSRQPHDLWPAPWIVPLTEPLPDEPWGVNHEGWSEFYRTRPGIYKTDWESEAPETDPNSGSRRN
jgi:hypothetical protein